MTLSTVAKVTLQNTTTGEEKTVSIKNPRDDLELTEVTQAFAPLLASGWLLTKSGSAYTRVSDAIYVTTSTID